MSAHNSGSGPRSNSYSENRFANWAEYEPWWPEVQAVHKRFVRTYDDLPRVVGDEAGETRQTG